MSVKTRVLIISAILAGIFFITLLAYDAPPILYLMIPGVGILVYFLAAPAVKAASRLESDGKIVTRNPDFVETAQIFKLSKVSIAEITTMLKKEGLPFSGLEWRTSDDAMGFQYNGWTAQFYKVDSDDEHDRYRFNFTQWQTVRYSIVTDIVQMNQLLTAIEKALIKLDPSTKVQTERLKHRTSNRFF